MRAVAVWCAGSATVGLASAQGTFAGTKRDAISMPMGSGTSLGIAQLAQMLLALGVVYLLVRYVLPKVASKLGKRLVTKVGSAIRIEESATFGGGLLYVVEVRGKSLLLSVGSQGVSCLADLTTPKDSAAELPTFGEILDDQPDAPVVPGVALIEVEDLEPKPRTELTEDQAREALARLRRVA